MEVMFIALALGVIVLAVWLSKKLNRYSLEMYDYTPIGISTILLAMIPYILIAAGLIFEGSDPANMEWATLFASLSIVGLYKWIKIKSDWQVALGATILLLMAGLPAFLILLSFFNRDGDNYIYYDD